MIIWETLQLASLVIEGFSVTWNIFQCKKTQIIIKNIPITKLHQISQWQPHQMTCKTLSICQSSKYHFQKLCNVSINVSAISVALEGLEQKLQSNPLSAKIEAVWFLMPRRAFSNVGECSSTRQFSTGIKILRSTELSILQLVYLDTGLH